MSWLYHGDTLNRSNCYILYEYEYRCVFPKRLSGQIPFKQQQALHMKEKLLITCFETPHALLTSILGISDTIETLTGIWDYLLKLLVIEWNLCTSVSRAKFSFIAYTTFYSPIFFPPVSLQTTTLKELQRGHANLTFFILFSRLNSFNTFLLCAYSNTNVVRHINVQDLGIYWLKDNFFISLVSFGGGGQTCQQLQDNGNGYSEITWNNNRSIEKGHLIHLGCEQWVGIFQLQLHIHRADENEHCEFSHMSSLAQLEHRQHKWD